MSFKDDFLNALGIGVVCYLGLIAAVGVIEIASGGVPLARTFGRVLGVVVVLVIMVAVERRRRQYYEHN